MSDLHTDRRFDTSPKRRRIRAGREGPRRSPVTTLAFVLAIVGIVAVVAWLIFIGPGSRVGTDVVDFSQATERIQELGTVRSHLRFAVVVREEGGNIIVRRLADQTDGVGMNNLTSMLFQDPTLIVELHGVATYGMRLGDLEKRVSQTDSTVEFRLPPADVLDVKLVAADTRIVAQMQGLLRSPRGSLLHEANLRGEGFVLQMARQDTTLRSLAGERTRELLALLVERAGKRAIFR